MNLKHLTDKALLDDTRRIAFNERQLLVKLLHHLIEIDDRKLFTELKYNSMHDFCVKELKYGEASSHYRIVSARILKEIPSVAQKIEKGLLTISNISLAVKHMKDRRIEEHSEKIKILDSIQNLSKRECEQKLFEISGIEKPKLTSLTIKDETYLLLQQARDLITTPMTQDELLQMLIVTFIENLKKSKFKTHSNAVPPRLDDVTRVISSGVKKAVHERDKGKCTKCESTHNLQYDHIKPFSLGGKSTLENIRLLCFNCNQRNRITAKL